MNKHVQIRNISDAIHRKLKVRAAERGMTVTDYVKRLIESDLAKPDWHEIARRIQAMPPLELAESSAAMIRHERDSR